MLLKQLHLKNFRLFKDCEIKFANNTTAVIGNNGAGKTSILDAIAICITHFTGELMSASEGYNIDAWFKKNDIKNTNQEGSCSIMLNYPTINNGKDCEVKVVKNKLEKGLIFNKNPEAFIKEFKLQLENDIIDSVPVIAYFNVNRTSRISKNTPKPNKMYNSLLHTYERSLSLSTPGFDIFKKWFVNQVMIENDLKVKKEDLKAELPGLKYIRKTLHTFFSVIEPGVYYNLTTKNEASILPDFNEEVNVSLCIEKDGVSISFEQLSHGEKMVIGLVVETARRLIIANKSNPQNGNGVIFVDEIELHLHPKWQKNIVKAFKTTFPKLNLIFTTHSPLVLSGVRKESIKVFNKGNEIPNTALPDIYSATADEILERLMNASKNSDEFKTEKLEIDRLFNELRFEEAKVQLNKLKSKIRSNPEWLNDYEQKIAFAIS